MGYMIIITIMPISFVILCYLFRNKDGLPTNWALVGMLPSLLINIHRFNDFCIELMEKSNLTFHFKGPWFANMNLMFTVDPTNVHYVLSKNSKGYIKGSKLNEILEPLGEGILTTDSTAWNYHRKVAQSFFHNSDFHHSLVNTTWRKIENGLMPVLDRVSDRGVEVDLQDLFLRFMYDTMCILVMDHDPKSLSVDLPNFPLIKAVANMERVAISRHALPTWVWKLQRWLNIGEEKKLKQSCEILDSFIYKLIDLKRREKGKDDNESTSQEHYNQKNVDLLTLVMNKDEDIAKPQIYLEDKYLRDTITNFFLAGGETTSTALSWFFYLLLKNPQVAHKIKEEFNELKIKSKDNGDDKFLRNYEEMSSKLVYLHAALSESLRLYPSIVYNPKTPTKPDILPSGHHVDPNTHISICIYAMGRMKSIWGDDCNEFKPERWISEDGTIKHEPSYRFSVFGSGPRTCIGKKMVFTLMKVVASFIIQNYDIEAIGKDQVTEVSMVLHMKDEFKVRVLRSI